ncbi:MAG: hypothetical protein AAFQ94_31775, partial [Bacteroidota bacterium]
MNQAGDSFDDFIGVPEENDLFLLICSSEIYEYIGGEWVLLSTLDIMARDENFPLNVYVLFGSKQFQIYRIPEDEYGLVPANLIEIVEKLCIGDILLDTGWNKFYELTEIG